MRDQKDIIKKIEKIQKVAHEKHYRGYSECRVCWYERNGSKEYFIDYFVWPEGYIHYLKDHNVAVDKEFGEYVDKFDFKKKHNVSRDC